LNDKRLTLKVQVYRADVTDESATRAAFALAAAELGKRRTLCSQNVNSVTLMQTSRP